VFYRVPFSFQLHIQFSPSLLVKYVLLLLLLWQVLIDGTNRPEFAVLDLTAGLDRSSRRSVIADMPLDAARQHVYAVTDTRVSRAAFERPSAARNHGPAPVRI